MGLIKLFVKRYSSIVKLAFKTLWQTRHLRNIDILEMPLHCSSKSVPDTVKKKLQSIQILSHLRVIHNYFMNSIATKRKKRKNIIQEANSKIKKIGNKAFNIRMLRQLD